MDYLAWKKSYVTQGTYPNYERWITRFVDFLGKPVSEIALDDIGRFKSYLREQGYAPKNIQYGLSIVRDFIGYQITVHNLQFPLKLFKIKVERAQSHYPLTEREYTKLLRQLSGSDASCIQQKLILRLLWETGVRIGELLSIRIKDLKECEMMIENEKNHKSRLIAWSRDTEKLLQIYLASRERINAKEDWVFVGLGYKSPSHLTARHAQMVIKRLAKVAGIKNKVSPHSFRHGFVHRQLAQGKAITTVAQMVGHSTTFNIQTYHQMSLLEHRQAWKTAA